MTRLNKAAARKKGDLTTDSSEQDDSVEPVEEVRPPLGVVIRRARKRADKTLQDIATETGLSISYLSQIERNLLTPSVSTLRSIAEVLHIPAGALVFARETRGSNSLVSVMRAGERRKVSFPQSNIEYELLTPDLRRRSSLLRVVAQPGAESGPSLTHDGEDVVMVLKGKLAVEVGGIWHQLSEGDSLYFNSELPHRWCNQSKESTEAIWMSTPPAF